MAEAAIQFLLETSFSLVKDEVVSIMGVDKDIRRLGNTLTAIQKVLEDAEEKQFHNQSIQNWLRQLNGVVFEIEDILDDYNTMYAELKHQGGSFLNKLKKVLYKRGFGKRIKDVAQQLEDIAKNRRTLGLVEREAIVHLPILRNSEHETGSVLDDEYPVYGRDGDRNKIVEMLLNHEQKLCVLPIIGLGGMGKTTLAQYVFKDDRLTHRFKTKIWVCVSDHYDLKRILKAMIESLTDSKVDFEELDQLQRRIREELEEKRYLLILDDVWNDNQGDWEQLRASVSSGLHGSSIVVTTRQPKVADIMGTLPYQHRLEQLLEEHCWLLFRRRAFGDVNEEVHLNLQDIGRRILRKCSGVPLAAKALGSILRFERDEKEWIRVEKSEIWNLPHEKNSIMPTLRLSYHYLSVSSKRCFVYCSVFPKDYVFDKTELIFHWISHGCISSSGGREVEDVGVEIWKDLNLRSFFQEVDMGEKLTTFKMHDLFHDLAQFMMDDITSESNTSASNIKIREVYYFEDPHIRISSCNIAVQVSTLTTITNYNSVRKLTLQGIDELPDAICKLKHLRCFILLDSNIRTLPRKFCRLYNLEILIMINCSSLECLPKNIRSMTNLRHVLLERCNSLSHMPEIGELVSLKVLGVLILRDGIDKQFIQLKHLNLWRKFQIEHLERVKSHSTASTSNLIGKPKPYGLDLEWDSRKLPPQMKDEEVLEALQPHPNLVRITIHGFRGLELPLWMKRMENITQISMHSCRNLRHVCQLGDLPLLKSLLLWKVKALEYILEENEVDNQAAKFPSLEHLYIRDMHNLKGWSKKGIVVQMFPNIIQISIQNCRNLRHVSQSRGLPLLKSLTLWGVEALEYIVEENEVDNQDAKFPSLEELKLFHMMNMEGWSKEGIMVEMFPNITRIIIHNCRYLRHVSQLGNLPLLKSLQLEGLKDLKYMVEENEDDNQAAKFPSLEKLELQNMENMKGWSKEGIVVQMFPNITQITIHNCRKLRHVSQLGDLLLLKSLDLWDLEALEYIVEENGVDNEATKFPLLEHLHIRDMKNMKGWSKEGIVVQIFPNLQTLKLERCDSMRKLSPSTCRGLNSLTRLSLKEFKVGSCFPEGSLQHLTALEELNIQDCTELEDYVWEEMKHLHLLKSLTLSGIHEMVSLPQALQHIPSLQSLSLSYLYHLTSLPDWLPNLTSLTFLQIIQCSKLESRCDRETGEDWHKISHITRFHIH